MQDVKNYLEENNYTFKENVSFKALTTYKTGGNTKFLVMPNNVEELKNLIKYLKNNSIKFKIFGNGSNILASDKDYDGVIIKLTNLTDNELKDNVLKLDAGCSTIKIANKYSKEGYKGLDFACGIPGTIGGAIFMNAGAYLSSFENILLEVTYLDEDLNIKTIKKDDMELGYRTSIFKHRNWIILSAKLKLTPTNKEELIELIEDRRIRRLSSQPLEYSSAGSVFRNPLNDYAGALIEKCNLKGYKKGNAEISEKHANFIVNKKDATSEDIKYLIDLAKKEVKQKYNVELKIEQELFNWE